MRVELTADEYAIVCGLVQDESEVNSAGIFSSAWLGLRQKFPIDTFNRAVREGRIEYEPEAGT